MPLHRALRSAYNAQSASIRLTKKNDRPLLSLTIKRSCSVAIPGSNAVGPLNSFAGHGRVDQSQLDRGGGGGGGGGGGHTGHDDGGTATAATTTFGGPKVDREATIVQDIPIRVLAPTTVQGLHQPHCQEPDVHITLPPLMQLKAVSDRFTRLALNSKSGGDGIPVSTGLGAGPRLEMAANMHGCLRLRLMLDSVEIQSVWTGLDNPELNPDNYEGGDEAIRNHPSTRMKELGDPTGESEEGWAVVRIDGKDWGKVMSVGRMGGRVVACKFIPLLTLFLQPGSACLTSIVSSRFLPQPRSHLVRLHQGRRGRARVRPDGEFP